MFNTVYQFRASTNREGYQRLDDVLAMHCTLYNAALQNRRDAWKMKRESIFYGGQSKELTAIRQDDPEWAAQHRRLATGTLKRVDLAFQAFFRRVKQGQTPGFPRFKPRQRFKTLETWGIEPAMLRVYPDQDKAAVTVKGLPRLEIRLKGRELPPPAQLTTLRITREGRRCTVSLGFREVKEPLPATEAVVGLDMRMGVARVVTSDGTYWERRNTDARRIKRLQRKVSRAVKGSNTRRKKVRSLANAHRAQRVSNHQAVHRFTSRIVQDHDVIAVEDLDIKAITVSGRGTVDEPGELVKLKAGRNRRALSQTWGKIRQQLAYKAEWAGRQFVEVDPAYTSRVCSQCAAVRAGPPLTPTFRCGACGFVGATAHNAAINILRRGLLALGEGGIKGVSPPLYTPQGVASIGSLDPMRVEITCADTS